MINALRRLGRGGVLLSLTALAAVAAAQEPTTALGRQLSRVDFGLSAIGVLSKSTSGVDDLRHNALSDTPSNTVGALVTVRYIKSPLVGLEFNYDYARFVQQYSAAGINAGADTLGVQANMSEYTFGWVFHPPPVFGIGTFASVGAGTTAFRPSKNGGLGFQTQARATYYYNVGFEQPVFSPKLGVRASFRQAFYLAPDFQQDYLRDHQHTFTSEPSIGVYLRF